MYVRAQLWVFVLLFRPWISAAVIVRESRYLLSFNYVISERRAQSAVCRNPLCELSFTDLTVRRTVRWICMWVLGERDTVFRCSVWGMNISQRPSLCRVSSWLMRGACSVFVRDSTRCPYGLYFINQSWKNMEILGNYKVVFFFSGLENWKSLLFLFIYFLFHGSP